MRSLAPSPERIAPGSTSVSTRQLPVRVLVLTGFRLLRDMIVRVLQKRPDILLSVAQESSSLAVAETIASRFDVLVANPGDIETLLQPPLHDLCRAFPDFRIVLINMDAGVADLLSDILGSSTELT